MTKNFKKFLKIENLKYAFKVRFEKSSFWLLKIKIHFL
jgi:hypothetical protein